MAVDLADLLPDFKAEISPLGTDPYADVSNNALVARLRNAFWEARLQGAFPNYREADGEIRPISGNEDMPREQQQLIILYAGLNVALASFQNMTASFRAQAGPVEYETAKSANLSRDVLAALREKLATALGIVIAGGVGVGSTAVFDAILERSWSLAQYETFWVR